MRARVVEDWLVLCSGSRELRGKLLTAEPKNLPHNEANRAFVVSDFYHVYYAPLYSLMYYDFLYVTFAVASFTLGLVTCHVASYDIMSCSF